MTGKFVKEREREREREMFTEESFCPYMACGSCKICGLLIEY